MHACLTTTDSTDLEGARVVQRHEQLAVRLGAGRVIVGRDHAGAVVVRIEAADQRVEITLSPPVALRVGAHIEALAAATLDPGDDAEALLGVARR